MKKYLYALTVLMCVAVVTGCSNPQTKSGEGAVLGGVLGAMAGGIIGHQTHDAAAGMLIGGAVGAASGAVIGSQMPQDQYAEPTVVAAQPVVVPAGEDTFSVNVPNSNGSYTVVVLRRSGSGFVGPQGEIYPDFPKVSQLKAMYGK